MSKQKPFYCVVDDTALTTNLDEIETWVQTGAIALVIPLYTLERLHMLKKDTSQIGQNARKAVKFLDLITSTLDLPHDPVVIQGPDDQYTTWTLVEARYIDAVSQRDDIESTEEAPDTAPSTTLAISPETLLDDLSIISKDVKSSPLSTPPLSPSVSEPQSNKTSPEVRCATVTKHDATPVPPVLKPLVNFVVWCSYENPSMQGNDLVFLTNSADAAQIAKDFGVVPKTIHQLRAAIAMTISQGATAESRKSKKKGSSRKSSFKKDSVPQTLFSYQEVSSEDEELVFKPRSKDLSRPVSSSRGSANVPQRGRNAVHSSSNSITAISPPKPQVPVEEIDPDSFDRGTFARGSTPLANVGNHYVPAQNGFGGGRGQRNFGSPTPRGSHRGNAFRGRGRGRLYVP